MNRATVRLSATSVVAVVLLGIAACTSKHAEGDKQEVQEEEVKRTFLVQEPAKLRPDGTLEPPHVEKGLPKLFYSEDKKTLEWEEKMEGSAWLGLVLDDRNRKRWFVNWDADRQPFDMVVVHHNATGPDVTPESIDAMQKERLYAPRYRSRDNDPFVKGLPIHSGHVVDGKERFIGYHHLVYHDGRVTTELSPLVKGEMILEKKPDAWYVDHVAWHAGNWKVNCRSVAICLVGNFTDEEPSEDCLKATAALVTYYRGFNPKLTVTGHSDYAKTECPGRTWPRWRQRIIAGNED